jgi:hypothetical protein
MSTMELEMVNRRQFAAAYERWIQAGANVADNAASELLQSAQSAWEGGDEEDMLSVLTLALYSVDESAVRRVVEGVASDNRRVAEHATAVAGVLAKRRVDLGQGADAALRAFSARFPESTALSDAVSVQKKRQRWV